MIKIGRIVLLFLLALSLSGCFVTDEKYQDAVMEISQLKNSLKELRENLGNYQYLTNDPKISFSIKDIKFQPPDSTYGSPTVKFKASLKQTNADFPLTNYFIIITFSILDENNNEIEDLRVSSEIENGVLSLAEEITLYGLKQVKFVGYKLVAKEYRWSPIYKFTPSES